jgi:hypothetical protein
MIDRLLARLAARILRHLFGACEPPYEPTCIACMAAQIIEAMKDI